MKSVVGVNTSAKIEEGIIGRPVYSVIAEDFAVTQEGTLHFQHLKREVGGLLHLTADIDIHLSQLTSLFADRDAARQGARQFVQAFIGPHGLDAAATPQVVEASERFAVAPALVTAVPSVSTRLLRVALLPAAVITMERTKLRAMVLHRTRLARLLVRALTPSLILRRSISQAVASPDAAAGEDGRQPRPDQACAVGAQSR